MKNDKVHNDRSSTLKIKLNNLKLNQNQRNFIDSLIEEKNHLYEKKRIN